MNLSESVKFFGAYGTLPPTRDKTLVQRKMFFLGAVALVALTLSGCFVGVKTKSGWHMAGLPPSTTKRLAAECTMARGINSGRDDSLIVLLKQIEEKQDKQYKSIIIDLQMENAALHAAN